MNEFNTLLEKMKKNAKGWKLNLINSSIGWNPEMIDLKNKQLLINIGLTSLSDDKLVTLKKMIKC